MPVLVVKRESLTRVLLPLHFDGVRVVIPQYPFATGRVQRKRVPDSVRNILAERNFPSLDLEPIAVLLIDDLVMEVKERTDLVFFQGLSISLDDIYVTCCTRSEQPAPLKRQPKCPWPRTDSAYVHSTPLGQTTLGLLR